MDSGLDPAPRTLARTAAGFSPLGLLATLALAGTAAGQQFRDHHQKAYFPSDQGRTVAAVAGDVDGDGDLDLVRAIRFGPLEVLRNDGSGRFDLDPAAIPPGTVAAVDLALGDLDGDGDLDLALLQSGAAPTLWTNDGRGGFSPTTGPAGDAGWTRVAAGDLDGDGRCDLLLTAARGPHLVLLQRGGVLRAAPEGATPQTPAGPIRDLQIGDIDGDGAGDVLLVAQGRAFVWLQRDGALVDASARLPALGGDVTAAAVGDLDRDGNPELVLAMEGALHVMTAGSSGFAVDGAPLATPPSASGATLGPPNQVALLDVDGDLDLDLVVAGPEGLGLLVQQSRRRFANGRVVATARPLRIVPLDADRDERTDVFLASDGGRDTLAFAVGGGLLEAGPSPLPWDPAFSRGLAAGDIDGDGMLDIVVAHSGATHRVLRNAGDGTFASVAGALPAREEDATACALFDADGNGTLDLLVTVLGDTNRMFLGDGRGGFGEVSGTLLPADADLSSDLAVGDLDADGFDDLLIANLGPNRLLLGGPGGQFVRANLNLPLDVDDTTSVALGDIDGDGDLDALLGNLGQNRLYLNDGRASFTDVTIATLPTLAAATTDVAFADVDGDGDPDILTVCAGAAGQLLLNDGTGRYTARGVWPAPPTMWHPQLTLADVDGDGDPDALVGAREGCVYLTNQAGRFVDQTATELPDEATGVLHALFCDVDGDADPDLVFARDGEDRLLLNRNRDLHQPELARMGTSIALRVTARHTPGSQVAALFANTQRAAAPIPFASVGVFHLDPHGLASLPLVSIPAGGTAVAVVKLPVIPAFLWARLGFQAALIDPTSGTVHFTGLVADRVVW